MTQIWARPMSTAPGLSVLFPIHPLASAARTRQACRLRHMLGRPFTGTLAQNHAGETENLKKKDTHTTEHTYFQVPTLYHIFYSAWRSNWQQLDKHGKSFRWAHFDCEEDNIPKVFAANQSRNTSDTSFISAKQTAYTGRASQAGNDSSYVNMLENHLFLIVAGSIQRYTCLREKNMCRDTSYFPENNLKMQQTCWSSGAYHASPGSVDALKFSYKF